MIRSDVWTRSQPRPIARSWTAQLAGVEEAEDLDLGEGRLEQLAVLLDRVLAQVPGVVGLLGALGGEGEPVRGRDEGQRRRLGDRRQQRRHVLDVLDRLQEDDRVERARRRSRPGRARSAGSAARSAPRRARGPRDWRRSRRRRRRAAASTFGAVALTAGEIGDAHAPDLRRDPLVDGEVAPVPVVLLRHVGQGPLAGQLERRDAVGLIGLQVALFRLGAGGVTAGGRYSPGHASGCRRHRRADPGRQHPLSRPRRRLLRRQVGNRLRRDRPGAGRGEAAPRRSATEPGPLGARARDRRRHRLLLAQPDERRDDRRA